MSAVGVCACVGARLHVHVGAATVGAQQIALCESFASEITMTHGAQTKSP
eukprot:COSAG01_NODE_50196_length_365_cov_0.962406_1_plen_49_part_10